MKDESGSWILNDQTRANLHHFLALVLDSDIRFYFCSTNPSPKAFSFRTQIDFYELLGKGQEKKGERLGVPLQFGLALEGHYSLKFKISR